MSAEMAPSFHPAVARSRATRSTRAVAKRAAGLSGVTCTSPETTDQAMSIAVYCQTLPLVSSSDRCESNRVGRDRTVARPPHMQRVRRRPRFGFGAARRSRPPGIVVDVVSAARAGCHIFSVPLAKIGYPRHMASQLLAMWGGRRSRGRRISSP